MISQRTILIRFTSETLLPQLGRLLQRLTETMAYNIEENLISIVKLFFRLYHDYFMYNI